MSEQEPYFDQWQRASRQHLDDAEERYFEHLGFTIKMAWDLVLTGLIVLTHGVVPAFFTTTASSRIERMYLHIRGRIGKSRTDQLDQDWQI